MVFWYTLFGGDIMKNIGSLDKIIRIILGLIVLSAFFVFESNLKYLGILGIILILTGLLKRCPLYYLFGINTCKNK